MSIDKKEIAEYIGTIVSDCYGVVGLVKATSTLEALSLLKPADLLEGVKVMESGSKYIVEVHLSIANELKVSEVINEVYKRLNYFLNRKYGDLFKKINVYVDDIRDL